MIGTNKGMYENRHQKTCESTYYKQCKDPNVHHILEKKVNFNQ